MQAQIDSDRLSIRTNLISTDRPDSSQLVDLHVYIIPKTGWKDRQNLAENEAIEQAISGGFVRVPPNLTIQDLRQQIMNVCGQDEEFPKEFVYLRSVGRCLTKVKPQQETELRVKNYRPPITFAPEIYILEGQHDEEPPGTPDSKRFLYRESHIHQTIASPPHLTTSRPQSLIKPVPGPHSGLPNYPSFVHSGERQNSNSFVEIHNTSLSNLSMASSTLSVRELAKLREEQERLRVRQNELARQRREMEQEQQRRTKELQEKQQNHSKGQGEKEEAAAVQIQTAYRSYRTRHKTVDDQKQRQRSTLVETRGLWSPEPEEERRVQSSDKTGDVHSILLDKSRAWRKEHQWSASSSMKCENIAIEISDGNQSGPLSPFRQAGNEIERLQKEAREFTRRKAEEEHAEEIQAHDVAQLSDRLEDLKGKRTELEAEREAIVRQMQQFHAQIAVRRKEERDTWKQKYLSEKKKTAQLQEQGQPKSKGEGDVQVQINQAKLRLNNYIKLREEAEDECQHLKDELHNIRSNLKKIEKTTLPKLPPPLPNKPLPPPISKQPLPRPVQHQPATIPINLDITLQY